MGKILKPLLVVAAIAVNVIPGVGQVLSAAMISAITTAGITAGLGLAASALGLGPKSPSISPSSRERLYASIDPATPRKLVFGETALATDIRYQEWTGNDQEYLSEIVCVASHKVQSVDEIWFEDKLAWTAAGGAQGEYAGYLTVDVRTEGNAGNYVVIGNGAKWGANRRMTGLAYLHLRFKVTGNSKKKESPFGQSIPQRMTIIGKACPVYDARFDSTRGGAGPMRADDQTTWAYTYAGQDIGRNPANQLLTYLLGWRINGKLALGRGIPPEGIVFDSFITAANACDEPVTLAAGGTEKRYRADGIFSEADDPRGVIDTFETTMNAKLRDAGGRFSLVVISNDLATPRFDFDDSDVLGEFRWTPTQDIERTFNEIRGRFTNPSRQALFQLVDYPRYRELPTDGIERVHVLDLPMVQSGSQAQRLAKQQFARNKYQGRFEAQMGARAWAVQLGDVVRLTFSALGWENRLFRVVEHGIRPDGVCPVVLQEEHADIYLWEADERPVVQPVALVPYDPSKSVLMQLLVAGEIDYANGATVESLRPAEPGADITGMHTSANTSAVGSRSAAAVNYDLDQAAATNTAQGLSITQILVDVDNLEATYGSTANAAASASAAQGYATTANTAATNAANANTAAQAALTDANAARDTAMAQATSAAGSASSAAGSATTATNQANAAQGFATSASGSANVATTQAGNAAASASAASSSAASASGSASAAGLSASAAQTSSVEAGAKNSPSLNYNPYFDQAKTYWFADGSMTTAANGSVSATFQGRANVLNAAGYLYGYGHLVPITPGNKYELQSTFYVGNAAAKHYLGVVPYDASGNSLTPSSGFYFVFAYQGFAVGWHTVAAVNDFSSFPTATHAQIAYLFNYESAAGDYGVDSILLRDVTTREASAANASAAATSASTAAIQATNAAQSASAAQTSATNANTSAGNAATSASQASTSASNAAGSASTASTQATNAANSAGVAAGHASAAAGSASTASTQATNAANSASAANASSVSAQSSATAAGLAQAATFPTQWHANNFNADGTTGSPLPTDSLSADGTRGEFTVGTSAFGYGVWERGIRPLAPGRKYRLHVTAAQTVNPGTTPYIFGVYVRGVLPNGTGDGTGDLWDGGFAPLTGVLANYTFDFIAPANPPGAIVGYRLGVLFNRGGGASPLPAGAKVIVTECYSRDITEQDAAAVSAAAAASSASSASTSASNAASSATSATNASNTAATQAGNASASASAASGSAASASTSASDAASSAASAASSAVLSAAVGVSSLLRNPVFADFPNASGSPPVGFLPYTANATPYRSTGATGVGYGVSWDAAPGITYGIYASPDTGNPGLSNNRPGFFVAETDFMIRNGRLDQIHMYAQGVNASGNEVQAIVTFFSSDINNQYGVALGEGVLNRLYSFKKLCNFTHPDIVGYNIYFFHGGADAEQGKHPTVFKLNLRPATPSEIRDQTVLAPLEATVSTHASAIATLSGRTVAFWQTEVVAGLANGATAFISARAETSPGNVSSTVAFGAREIHLFNSSTGGWRRAMTVANNEVIIYGSLTADAGIYLGTGVRWQVALRSKEFAVSDGVPVAYGVNIGNPALIVFKGDNLAPLGSGETYKLYAESSTGTGFTPRLRIITPGSTTSYNLTVDTAPGTGPTRQIDKAGNPDASNNTYTFSLSFSYTGYGYFYGGGGGGGGGGGPIP